MSTNSTIAARVPEDLRHDLETLALRDPVKPGDLGIVMRRLLREGADRELGRTPSGGGLFDAREGTSRRNDRQTAKRAATTAAPRTGTDRYAALSAIASAEGHGMTTDEAALQVSGLRGRPVVFNGFARRVTDLLQAGMIEAAHNQTIDEPIVRPTRNGADAQVWIATGRGVRALDEANRKAQR